MVLRPPQRRYRTTSRCRCWVGMFLRREDVCFPSLCRYPVSSLPFLRSLLCSCHTQICRSMYAPAPLVCVGQSTRRAHLRAMVTTAESHRGRESAEEYSPNLIVARLDGVLSDMLLKHIAVKTRSGSGRLYCCGHATVVA